MTTTTPTYIPTAGDICYMVKGDSDNRTFGAIVRVTKVRSWKHTSKVWIENVEGLGMKEDCLEFWDYLDARKSLAADVARELLNVNDASIEDKENLAAARINRAKRLAEEAQKRRDAEQYEKDFRAEHGHIVDAPLDFSEPSVVVSKDCRRVIVSSCATLHAFSGRGHGIEVKRGTERVSAWFEREETWNNETHAYENLGKFRLSYNGAHEFSEESAQAFANVLKIAIRGMEALNIMIEEEEEFGAEDVAWACDWAVTA